MNKYKIATSVKSPSKSSNQLKMVNTLNFTSNQTKASSSKKSSVGSTKKNRCSSLIGLPKVDELSFLLKDTKDYNYKVEKLRNRILHLKKEEMNYMKTMTQLRKKEEIDERIQNEKRKHKEELEKRKKEEKKEIMVKKRNNEQLKKEVKDKLKKSFNENIENKKNKYKIALNDRMLLQSIVHQYQTSSANKNSYLREKVQYQRNKYATQRAQERVNSLTQSNKKYMNKLSYEKDLNRSVHQMYERLETLERECFENLQKTITKTNNYKQSSKFSLFSTAHKKKGLNRSMDSKIVEPKLKSYTRNSNSISSKKTIYISNKKASRNSFDTNCYTFC